MTWFKIDDGFYMNMKVVHAGNAAVGLWVRGGAWCSQQLTDGYIPAAVARMLGSEEEIDCLVEAGLWCCVDGGYLFPDWLEYNPAAEEVKADKARRREAGKVGGTRSGVVRRSTNEAPASTISEAPASTIVQADVKHVLHESLNPDPTRPDPYIKPPPRTAVDNSVRKVVVAASKQILQAAPPGVTPRNRSAYLAGMQARLTADHDDLEQLIARDGPEIAIQQLVDRELGIEPTDTGPPPLRHDPDCPHCDGSGWRSLDELTVDRCDCTPPALATVTELRAPA